MPQPIKASHNFYLMFASQLSRVFNDDNPKDPQMVMFQLMVNKLELEFIKAPNKEKLDFLKNFRTQVQAMSDMVERELLLIDDEIKTLESPLPLDES